MMASSWPVDALIDSGLLLEKEGRVEKGEGRRKFQKRGSGEKGYVVRAEKRGKNEGGEEISMG